MNKIVVDTNIIISAILNPEGKIGELLMFSQKQFRFFAPNLVKTEITKHRLRLLQFSELSEMDFDNLRDLIFNCITFVSEEQIPFEYWHNALPIVRDVDMDDITFIVLTEFIEGKLWSGDKKLIKGIEQKGFTNYLSTEQIYRLRLDLKN